MIAKTKVVEDAAAANMLAEALRALSPGGNRRCLLDAGLPADGARPSTLARSSAGLARIVYVVGGPAAVPDAWLADQFGVGRFTRVAGADRWATQANVAAAIVALASGNSVQPYDPRAAAAAMLELPPNGTCYGTAVLAKLNIAAERAAANMLAAALTAISGDPKSRCLVNVGDPAGVVPPTAVAVSQAHQAAGVYLLGGTVAVPQAWIENGFDVRFLQRISGPDRWATQAAVAETIINIAQGGILPHQYIDEAGDIISIHGKRHVNASAVLRGDPTASYVGLPTSASVDIDVDYCARASRLDSGDKQDAARAEIQEAVELLTDQVAPFFNDQSSGKFDIEFSSGSLLSIETSDVSSGEWDMTFTSDGAAIKACKSAADSDSLVMIDQRVGSLGVSSAPKQAIMPIRAKFWLHYKTSSESSVDALWLRTAAHEIGHSWLAFCHPHTKEAEHRAYDCRQGHDDHVYSSHLADNNYSVDNPDLCSVMSYCNDDRIMTLGVFFDENFYSAEQGGPDWIGCGQRYIAGWPDGPPTPYGECREGVHLLVNGHAPTVNVTSEWLAGQGEPLISVTWDHRSFRSCASHVQISQERHPTWRNISREYEWFELKSSTAGVEFDVDEDSRYSVKLRYRCPSERSSFVESEWSATSEVSTPANRTGAPGTPGKPVLSSAESQGISVDWSAASGVVVRHKVQWRAVGATSWNSRTQHNAANYFGTDGLDAGTCYEIRVRAENSTGNSPWSPTTEVCTTGSAELPTPSGPELTAGTNSIRVEWGVPLVYHLDVLANAKGFTIEWATESSRAIVPIVASVSAAASDRSVTIQNLTPGRSYQVRIAAVGPNGKAGTFTKWKSVTLKPERSVSVAAGPVNSGRTNSGSCGSGNDCHDLRYTISGLGSGPYALECWFNGQRTWRGQWSGKSSTGCYYSSAFSGTVQVAVDGVKSNTITVTGTQSRSEPDAPGRPSLTPGDGEIAVSWTAPDGNGASIDRFEVRWRRTGGSWSKQAVTGSSSRHSIGGLRDGASYEVHVRARNSVGWSDWSPAAAAATDEAGSVSVAAGPVNSGRTNSGSCGSGNDCHDLRYTISGLGSGPYALECWFNGQRTWRGQWSGKSSTGCYYSSAFSGTVQVAVDGVKSNTITVTGTQSRSEPDAPGRPSLTPGDGEIAVSWTAPDGNGASIDRYEVRYRRSGRASWSNWDGNGSSRRLRIASTGAGVTYEVGVRARNSEGWGPWSPTATITTQQAQASVTISAGPVNSTRTSRGSCSGNSCHDLRYTINGLGSGRYTLECWFNGQRAWRGNWSGNSSTGCYYSSTFRGTIHVVIDGLKSNTITIR
ncbi:MAG: fibronectin type III domain-containing protein [Acidimicrobiaceae bacterium]|nr:fibronectin type III domain-containing protein [Acidimicrobiaceae bacterium]